MAQTTSTSSQQRTGVGAPAAAAKPTYVVRCAEARPDFAASWEHPVWAAANTLEVSHFHPKSSDHRPVTRAKALYDAQALYVCFDVRDCYVRCVQGQPQSFVSRDSCAEFFVQPSAGKGYFNFEVNCGGTMLLYYIEDHTRIEGAMFARYTALPEDALKMVRIHHSLPKQIAEEIPGPVQWRLGLEIPLAMFERYAGRIGSLSRQVWKANFYKCGDETSHPHWASWSPIGKVLNFHQPEHFGWLHFE